jgi:divalent metal cation (Fe/Co/Zn/Cd) transporter
MARDSHDHPMANLRQAEAGTGPGSRFAEGQRITWISVGVNIALTAMQIVVGLIAHSQSLIADAMHTLSDIVADAFVLFANRKGAEAADADHPYGHGRYETAASLVLGLLLAGTGAGILVTAAAACRISAAHRRSASPRCGRRCSRWRPRKACSATCW